MVLMDTKCIDNNCFEFECRYWVLSVFVRYNIAKRNFMVNVYFLWQKSFEICRVSSKTFWNPNSDNAHYYVYDTELFG